MKKIFQRMVVLAMGAIALSSSAIAETSKEQTYALSIQSQSLDDALLQLAKQSGLQLAAYPDICAGLVSSPLDGRYTLQDALQRLLANTPLRYELVNPRTIAIRLKSDPVSTKTSEATKNTDGVIRLAEKTPPNTAAMNRVDESAGDDDTQQPVSEKKQQAKAGISEILQVNSSRILNVDIPRSRDDAQPYVVFNREELERSGATDLNDFFKKRLTMNTQGSSAAQGQPGQILYGNNTQINLRGLGANQTLILIDGRRATTAVLDENTSQPSINGIPFSAIERIEILPTTASGIYGGSATGGVVNVILRRDYTGTETQATCNLADRGPNQCKVDFSTGFNFENGKTNVMLAGSYLESSGLEFHDREFVQRAQARIIENNYPAGLLFLGLVPPLGATTNIRSADGSPLFGPGTSSFTSVPVGYAGGGGLAPLQTNAGRYNLALANTNQLNSGGGRSLLPSETDKSLLVTLRQRFNSTVEAFIEGQTFQQRTRFRTNSQTPSGSVAANAPNNPFGKLIYVAAPLQGLDNELPSETDNYRAVGGVIVHLPRKWTLAGDFSWGRYVVDAQDIATPTLALSSGISNGTFDVLRDLNTFPLNISSAIAPPPIREPGRATSKDATLRAAGALFSLPGGDVMASSLVEHRTNAYDENTRYFWNLFFNSYSSFFNPRRSQIVDSAYVELTTPLVSEKNNLPGLELLELQLAVRHDRYVTHGANTVSSLSNNSEVRSTNKTDSTDPTIALRYQPFKDVMVRASYGTGFIPPTINQLVSFPNAAAVPVTDPKRNNEAVLVPVGAVLDGGNPNLQPEQSKSWSAGIIFTPQFVSGLRLSVDYSRIEKTENIASPFIDGQDLVNNEDLVPTRVTRAAAPAGQVGQIIGLNNTLFNIARAKVEAYDVALDYEFDVALGKLAFYSLATWQTHYKTQVTLLAPVVENVGMTFANPLKLKGNAGVTWRRNSWTADWSASYFDSYIASTAPGVVINQGNGGRIPSQIYHNLFGSYRFTGQEASMWLKNAEVQLGIQNVFNTEPPVDLGATNIFYSAFGDPRLRNYRISIKKSFN